MNEEPARSASRPRTAAGRRRTWWPGWIWAIPIAAIGIVVWLMLRALSSRGVGVTVQFDNAAGMAVNSTKVLYRGLEVGTVTDLALARDGRHVNAHLDIDGDMRPYVTSGSRFYLIDAQPTFSDPSSLKSIVSGPSIELVPGAGSRADHFVGIVGKPPDRLEITVPYAATFSGAVGGIEAGSPVELGGFEVGEVSSAQLATDAATGGLETRVMLVLDPTRFHIESAPPAGARPASGQARTGAGADWTTLMNSTLASLVRHGLRASITQTPPLIGSPQVTLEMLADAPQARLDYSGRYPRIPTEPGGGVQGLTRKLGRIPIEQIADNVRAITDRVKTLADSPQLDESIRHLDGTLTELDRTLHAAGPQLGPTIASVHATVDSVHRTVDSLRKTANDIDVTASAARRMMSGSAAAPGASLQQALRELTDAARSIRSLADYLDQHPEALIEGRH